MKTITTFEGRLKDLRKKKHFTQQQVAEYLGITKAAVSVYENGISQPSLDTLVKFALLYGTSTDYILGLDQRKKDTLVLNVTEQTDENLIVSIILKILASKEGV